MKNLLTFLFVIFSLSLAAQPTFIGTSLVDNNYATHNLNDLGAFRQVRLQAVSSAGMDTRIWEFATGDYFNNWRPYSFPSTIAYNQVIDPATQVASARYNSGFGGSSSFLPAVTAGNYYTINVTEFGIPSDQFMSVLETTYSPANIVSVTPSPGGDPGENEPVTITAVTAVTPGAGEQFFIRYSTDNFVSSGLVPFSFAGTSGTAQIPGLPEGTAVQYYLYSSNFTSVDILANAAAFGQLAHDMVTLNLENNGGTNYSYVVQMPLPINLTAFGVTPTAQGLELKWETASEINNSHFDIEKSTDTREWSSIAQVKGNETTDALSHYTFLDRTPDNGTNYYRLKQVDYDAAFSFSEVQSALWRKDNKVEMYPNPAVDRLFFKQLDPNALINIFDLNGRQVLSSHLDDNSLDISFLEKGVYQIQYIQNGEPFQKQIVVID